jgi:sortase A
MSFSFQKEKQRMKNCIVILFIILFITGIILFSRGMYMGIKAYVAQFLLETSWNKAGRDGNSLKPWPWADFEPAARLIFPKYGKSVIVLSSSSGEALAFGPGCHAAGVPPGERGNCIIAGHRETHFHIIKDLKQGDTVELCLKDNTIKTYRITGIFIVDRSDTSVLINTTDELLTLVTCYPFDAVLPGPERYVVIAWRS